MDCPAQPNFVEAIEGIVSTDRLNHASITTDLETDSMTDAISTDTDQESVSQLCFHRRLFGNEVADNPKLVAAKDPVRTFQTVRAIGWPTQYRTASPPTHH